jgi:hypothetical protein
MKIALNPERNFNIPKEINMCSSVVVSYTIISALLHAALLEPLLWNNTAAAVIQQH